MIESSRGRPASDAGFTLIELLVVMMMMAVLIAMSVPSYMGVVKGVQEATTQSDLGSDRSALVAYGIDNNGLFPTQAGLDTSGKSLLTGYGWQRSSETKQLTYFPNASRTSWCLQGTSVTGSVFRVSPANPTAQGTCSALGETNY